ncbi:MAG: class I SAM-dependent methyltransferase [Candidatus Omnitrophica bacterium]|nr:class I SAM-dependent methyltransferase [Candidatus Omnitrophota bacterium]
MKEEDIRKREVFGKYLRLVEEDAKRYFDAASFTIAACPSCGAAGNKFEFDKLGFRYVSCAKCATLFVNPRPSFKAIRDFYSNSKSTSFWVNDFFKPVAEARREKIFAPRAEFIRDMLKPCKGLTVGDIGAGFGIFLEEMRKLSPDNRYVAIEPSVEMADICRKKGLSVECACLEDLSGMDGKFDALSAFELAEHLLDPVAFFKKASALLKKGGKLFITTLNGLGFDILLLWERSKSITPPHHLNFFNPGSLPVLLKRCGFEVTDVSTPGKLDWDIVEGMIKNEGVSAGRLWDALAGSGSRACKDELQAWISRNGLSSHMMVVARKL